MNFLGLCFKLRTEVVVMGIGGWRKKKRKKKEKKKECLVLGDRRRFELHQVINGVAAGDGGDRRRSDLSFFSFFFLPFCLSHLRPIKKSTIGATNWLLWVCEFSGCFKDANEFCGFVLQAQNRSGCCGYWGLKEKKKKGMPGLKSLVLGGNCVMKWCEVGRLIGMPDMLLRYGSHKK